MAGGRADRLRLRLRIRPRTRARPKTARTANLCNNFKTEIALAPVPHIYTRTPNYIHI